MNRRSGPAWETFPAETLKALADGVEIDDVVDRHVSLPDTLVLECTQVQMRSCFALCWQFWNAGVVRSELIQMVKALARDGDLDPPHRLRYKHIRAMYKQLRAALLLYGRHHREPLLFRTTVRVLGSLQDAFRHGRGPAVHGYGLILRLLLSPPIWNIVKYRVGRVHIDTAPGFVAYRKREVGRLKQMLVRKQFSGREFHAMRKIISRQVAFYGHLIILQPNEATHTIWRYLSAINGLMGARHDELVEEAVANARAYRSARPLAHDTRQRLAAFVTSYGM